MRLGWPSPGQRKPFAMGSSMIHTAQKHHGPPAARPRSPLLTLRTCSAGCSRAERISGDVSGRPRGPEHAQGLGRAVLGATAQLAGRSALWSYVPFASKGSAPCRGAGRLGKGRELSWRHLPCFEITRSRGLRPVTDLTPPRGVVSLERELSRIPGG